MSTAKARLFQVEHFSDFRYGEPAHGSLMLLRLHPLDDEGGQRVLAFSLHIDPLAYPTAFGDSFGNTCHLFNIHRQHRQTTVLSRAQVETAEAPAETHLQSDAWTALPEIADPVDFWEFLHPSRFARPSAALDAFITANDIRRGADPLSSLREMAYTLHRAFTYEPGSTAVDSPIERVLETRRGVCQDYTHVMIAIARSWGVPSRYVSGYLHFEGASGEQSMVGASHSWAEFLLPDLGWIGIDPTNDTLADHRHVRVAVGRDYADAAPTRGAVFGGGDSTLEIRVTVVRGDEPRPQGEARAEQPNLRNLAPTPYVHRASADQ